jgi:hypothetical protein
MFLKIGEYEVFITEVAESQLLLDVNPSETENDGSWEAQVGPLHIVVSKPVVRSKKYGKDIGGETDFSDLGIP